MVNVALRQSKKSVEKIKQNTSPPRVRARLEKFEVPRREVSGQKQSGLGGIANQQMLLGLASERFDDVLFLATKNLNLIWKARRTNRDFY